jgi:hypothetical protein
MAAELHAMFDGLDPAAWAAAWSATGQRPWAEPSGPVATLRWWGWLPAKSRGIPRAEGIGGLENRKKDLRCG